MKNIRQKVWCAIFILFFQFSTFCNAITETYNFEFNDILKKAIEQSYDLKIADFDIFIAKQGIRGARSEYFPKINASIGSEYTKNFKDYANTSVSVVGDAFVNPYTRFQSLMGITLSYNIFDFGVRKGKLDIAKEDTELKELLEKEQQQALTLTLIDTFSKIDILKKQIDINEKILELNKKNQEYKKRLFEAKEISKTELNSQNAQVQKNEIEILELKALAQETLNWINFYTKNEYQLENLKIKTIEKPNINPMEFNDYTKSLTWLIQEKEIKKKELALKVAKRNNLPKVNAYSRYYLYGSNHSSYNKTLEDLGPSNYTIGATVFMPVFDGMKNSSEIQSANLELQQQLIKRDKEIAQYMTKIATMKTNLIYLEKQIDTNKSTIKELEEKYKSTKKLADNKISTPIELNEAKIELLKEQIELEKNTISSVAIIKAIETMNMN